MTMMPLISWTENVKRLFCEILVLAKIVGRIGFQLNCRHLKNRNLHK